jgi:hypothetical protein
VEHGKYGTKEGSGEVMKSPAERMVLSLLLQDLEDIDPCRRHP